ncbi:hypothetical protein ACR820_02935 [Streptomyces netropsis]
MTLRIRDSVSFVVAIGIPFILLVGGVIAFTWATGNTGQVDGVKVAYLSGDANIRVCPKVECQSSDVFKEGQQVVTTRQVTGDAIDGEKAWIEIQYGDEKRYIHKSFVLQQRLSTIRNYWGFLTPILMCPVILLAAGQRSGRVRRWAVTSPTRFDGLLFGGVLGTGLACGVVGFLYSQLAQEDSMSFLGAAFANVGAGLVGAAVTFVLFQSMLAGRSPEATQIDDVKAEVNSLRVDLESVRGELNTTISSHASSTANLLADVKTELMNEMGSIHSDLTQEITRQSDLLSARLPDSSG